MRVLRLVRGGEVSGCGASQALPRQPATQAPTEASWRIGHTSSDRRGEVAVRAGRRSSSSEGTAVSRIAGSNQSSPLGGRVHGPLRSRPRRRGILARVTSICRVRHGVANVGEGPSHDSVRPPSYSTPFRRGPLSSASSASEHTPLGADGVGSSVSQSLQALTRKRAGAAHHGGGWHSLSPLHPGRHVLRTLVGGMVRGVLSSGPRGADSHRRGCPHVAVLAAALPHRRRRGRHHCLPASRPNGGGSGGMAAG